MLNFILEWWPCINQYVKSVSVAHENVSETSVYWQILYFITSSVIEYWNTAWAITNGSRKVSGLTCPFSTPPLTASGCSRWSPSVAVLQVERTYCDVTPRWVLGNCFVCPPYLQDSDAFPLLSLGQYLIFFVVIVKNVTIVCHSCCIENCNSNSDHRSERKLDNAVCFFAFLLCVKTPKEAGREDAK